MTIVRNAFNISNMLINGKINYILTWRVDIMAKLRSALME
jgi:hypothetical protein